MKTYFDHEQDLDKMSVISLLAEGLNTYDIVTNYTLKEGVIVECFEYLDKEVIIQGYDLSENFIKQALQESFFIKDDIKNLSMITYTNLSEEFILENKEWINWERMMLYLSTQSDSFAEEVGIINEHNLWHVISANDLPIDFIREYKDKLDWKFLSIVKNFTDEEKVEFSDYIQIKEIEESELKNEILPQKSELTQDELEELIEKISKNFKFE